MRYGEDHRRRDAMGEHARLGARGEHHGRFATANVAARGYARHDAAECCAAVGAAVDHRLSILPRRVRIILEVLELPRGKAWQDIEVIEHGRCYRSFSLPGANLNKDLNGGHGNRVCDAME